MTQLAFADSVNLAQSLTQNVQQTIVGQTTVVRDVVTTLLAGGHCLIEGVPGLGKTLLARTLTQLLGGEYKRIQFTADLMPADVAGHTMFDFQSQTFNIRRGPVFCNFLLADEINRAPAKTQSALLEAMQEQHVTIDGQTHNLPQPIMVMATQNPIEQDGTYPLPQAQMDRFLSKIQILYPTKDEEVELVKLIAGGMKTNIDVSAVHAIMNPEQLRALQATVASLPCDAEVADYIVRIVRATREHTAIDTGAGPRASLSLLQASRAHALMSGHEFVTPDDVKHVAHMVLRHRLRLSAEFEIEGKQIDDVITELLAQIEAPRQ
jgi:MoxR-like ATPase